MTTEFYLLERSFRYKEGISENEIEDKIINLSNDYSYIRKYKDADKIYVHDSIYSEIIFPSISVQDVLYDREKNKNFDKDVITALRIIIDRSENTDIPADEIVHLLEEHSEEKVIGIICLHRIDDIAKQYLVYNQNNWIQFHRYFLGIYPKDSEYFYNESLKYFQELFLHKRNIDTISDILQDFSERIVFHLSCLNDKFNTYKKNPYNRNQTLKEFSIACKLDEEASSEGNITRKNDFTFTFKNDNGMEENVCCEPHMKLCRSNHYPGDKEYYFNRIYFYEGKRNIENGKILVGHIGKHL